MHDLEDDLSAALHERAAGITLDRDLLRPAVRRVRRRNRVRRAASVAGGLGLAGAVAASGLLITNHPAKTIDTRPPLDIAYVTARARAALDNHDVVEQVRVRVTMAGVGNSLEVWYDPATGDQRTVEHDQERSTDLTKNELIFTQVDHAARTWERTRFSRGPEDQPGDALGAPTPAEVRDLLAENASPWTLIGQDDDGTYHLRQIPAPGSPVDVWVDGTTYRPTRMVTVKEQKATAESTFAWLPRTAPNLGRVTVHVPPGYRHVAPRAEGPSAR